MSCCIDEEEGEAEERAEEVVEGGGAAAKEATEEVESEEGGVETPTGEAASMEGNARESRGGKAPKKRWEKGPSCRVRQYFETMW